METNKNTEQYKVEIISSVKRGRGRPRIRFDPVPWNRSDQYRFCLAGKVFVDEEGKIKIEEAANA
jgi:hypothetical protein